MSGQIWVGLGRSGSVWAGLGRSGPVWVGLGRSGPVWAGLGRSGSMRADWNAEPISVFGAQISPLYRLQPINLV